MRSKACQTLLLKCYPTSRHALKHLTQTHSAAAEDRLKSNIATRLHKLKLQAKL